VSEFGPWVVDREPSRRFPVYTRGNSGEVFPNVMTPMTGSLIGDAAEEGQIQALRDVGLLVDRDLSEPGTVGTGVFGGYLYGNLSLVRVLSERAPGMSADDADRQMAGLTDEAPQHRRQPGDRSRRATVASTWTMGRRLLRPDISEIDDARVSTARWCAGLPDPATRTDDELIDFVAAYPPRFAAGMCRLLSYSAYAGAGISMVEQLAERTGAAIVTSLTLTSGLGTIDSASPAFRLWELGRLVAQAPTLSGIFDDGADRASIREASDDPDVARFDAELRRFVDVHGARGPDEWELASETWGTDPQIALAAINRLRFSPPDRDPHVAQRRLAAERERTTAEVRGLLARPLRPAFDRLVRAAHVYSAGRERAKAVFIADTYPVRRALFELADRARARGGPDERRDCFLVTIDELRDFVADPRSFGSVIDERRRQRDYLQDREPPFVFDGAQPDPSTWPLRSRTDPDRMPVTPELRGQGVCPGVARGTARVIRDPAAPGELQPQDILVAPITDPAWTPLFLAVAGVVVEVGAQLSHAAIVARELGIPAIVGVADATRILRDGQSIEIDGTTGIVTVH
jgi:phosphohistidine swiveling domain-containing protein